ncbi:DinB family protein [Rosistilla carotiformis]|uniref:DinB family protein n=1 Tax=Rosistilla carotiformis TaxID=2528017 RepID=A0A518JWI2_9BACT|nr:DinB family protein [Rosistilla carotiformis]
MRSVLPIASMDLLDRFLGHDAWATEQLLGICAQLADDELDRPFDIGHQTIRRTLDHIIHNMEIWSSLMANDPIERASDASISAMTRRLEVASARLGTIARQTADSGGWDEMWYDHLENPPRNKRFGTAIAHVITHSMHHRAQLLYMLRLTGITDLPEGDVFSWETQNRGRTNG